MANYSISEIKRDVRIVLGENEEIQSLLTESDDNAIENNDIIGSMILHAIDKVNSIAPLELLTDIIQPMETDDAVIVDKYGGYGKMELDARDFLRFVSFQEEDWDVPVYEITDHKGDDYLMLHSRFEGVRASVERPAVAILERKDKFVLEFYPGKVNEPLYGLYIPSVYSKDFDFSGDVAVAERTYKAVIYLIANMYLISIKEGDFASMMSSECIDLLGLPSNNSVEQ